MTEAIVISETAIAVVEIGIAAVGAIVSIVLEKSIQLHRIQTEERVQKIEDLVQMHQEKMNNMEIARIIHIKLREVME